MRLVFYRTDTGGDRPAARKVMAVEIAQKKTSGRAVAVKDRTRITHWRQFSDFFEIV